MITLILLGLFWVVIACLALELWDTRKKLRAERKRADDAADDAQKARARMNTAVEQRERAILGYGALLEEVQEAAVHLRDNHEPFVAQRLQKVVDDRYDALRRFQ